jgi:endoribonuclease LACTB2
VSGPDEHRQCRGYDSTNYYVLGASTNRLLVDVGWPGTLPRLLAMFKHKDIPLQDIGYLLITHYHPDHAGLAQEVKAKGVRLIVLAQQLPAIPLQGMDDVLLAAFKLTGIH